MKEINNIPSKSYAHRAYICEALARIRGSVPESGTEIVCGESSADIDATKECVKEMAFALAESRPAKLRVGESGSTLRFLLPVVGALGCEATIFEEGRLPDRPILPLTKELEKNGMKITGIGTPELTVSGRLEPGDFYLPGNVSSQFISGLLMALPLLSGHSEIHVSEPIESASYIDMTLSVLSDFGVQIYQKFDTSGKGGGLSYIIDGPIEYKAPPKYVVEGDWSNAAFWIVAGVIGREPVRINGLTHDSLQGDKAIVDILRLMGANIEKGDDSVNVFPSELYNIAVRVESTPDLVPALALAMAVAEGTGKIEGAKRLRLKESDRLGAISAALNNLGADVVDYADGLEIVGKKSLQGGHADSFGDHRIAMMCAVSSLVSNNKVLLTHAGAVNKSFPTFFDRFFEIWPDAPLDTDISK
ncbi:MAG: 3-phosphoshikimate 1-carboxyvinyltransferase [Eubacterium sp.]